MVQSGSESSRRAIFFANVRRALANRGFLGAMHHALLALYRVSPFKRIPPDPFDLKHGTNTGGILGPLQLGTHHANSQHITAYLGTPPSLVRIALARWQATLSAHTVSDYSFIDIGCGKGRVLMLASELPFRSITGIDLSAKLLAVATRNFAVWRKRYPSSQPIHVRLEDALALPLPAGPVLLYLFHPFDQPVMEPFVTHLYQLSAERTEPIDAIYANPELEALWMSLPGVELLFDPTHTAEQEQRYRIFRMPGRKSLHV